jgi:hypothetical protein
MYCGDTCLQGWYINHSFEIISLTFFPKPCKWRFLLNFNQRSFLVLGFMKRLEYNTPQLLDQKDNDANLIDLSQFIR